MPKKSDTHYLERTDTTWSTDSIRFINTPSLSARQTFFYVQEVGYFCTRPPYFTERANLSSFLIFYTISGEGALRYRNHAYTLPPGSITFLNCMEHHYYECSAGHEWEFLWLHFNGTNALGYYEEFMKNEFHILAETDPFFTERTMRRILSLTQKKDLHSEIIVSGLITELLTHLLILNSSEHLELGTIPAYLTDILKKIEKHFREPISLDELSSEFGVSKFHLSREFKRYIGTTPHEYLILMRLNDSKELLKYTTMTVEQIAFACGFHQVSHYINLFKSREKMTPLRFRREWTQVE